VIEAAMRCTLPTALPLLIEATCNQVNQDGGYTGMTPADFRRFVEGHRRAGRLSHRPADPWRRPSGAESVEASARRSGHGKGRNHDPRLCGRRLHQAASGLLDGLRGRAGGAGRRRNRGARRPAGGGGRGGRPKGGVAPVYIIGTEVPIPGGAMEEIEGLEVTSPEAALTTFDRSPRRLCGGRPVRMPSPA
jgi:hypothetical protein